MLNKQRKANKMNQSSPYLPILTELYLCEHCGADYNSLDEVMVSKLFVMNRIAIWDISKSIPSLILWKFPYFSVGTWETLLSEVAIKRTTFR